MGKVVCVTGASGYIASWLVKYLLRRGYTVKATVRNLDDPSKVAHLKELEGRLQLFEADILEPGSFDSIVQGCDGVFHTASPVLRSVTHPQKWYWLAKTLAEEAAWKYAEQNGIQLLSINPGFVIGPLLHPTLNTSSYFILELLKGNEVFPDYQFVDVRDVAEAHILAFENPCATGRYILVESSMSHSEAVHVIHNLYPSFDLPNNFAGKNPIFEVSKKKAQSLGINFIPFEVSFKDTVESFVEKGFLNF